MLDAKKKRRNRPASLQVPKMLQTYFEAYSIFFCKLYNPVYPCKFYRIVNACLFVLNLIKRAGNPNARIVAAVFSHIFHMAFNVLETFVVRQSGRVLWKTKIVAYWNIRRTVGKLKIPRILLRNSDKQTFCAPNAKRNCSQHRKQAAYKQVFHFCILLDQLNIV